MGEVVSEEEGRAADVRGGGEGEGNGVEVGGMRGVGEVLCAFGGVLGEAWMRGRGGQCMVIVEGLGLCAYRGSSLYAR